MYIYIHIYAIYIYNITVIYNVPEELWLKAHNIVQKAVTKTISKERKCRKAKWLSDKALK